MYQSVCIIYSDSQVFSSNTGQVFHQKNYWVSFSNATYTIELRTLLQESISLILIFTCFVFTGNRCDYLGYLPQKMLTDRVYPTLITDPAQRSVLHSYTVVNSGDDS